MDQDVERHDESELRAHLREARARVETLVVDLRAVDSELEGLGDDRRRFAALERACVALDELDELGASDLFWSVREAGGGGADHLRLVRGRIDEFSKRLDEIERRRLKILEEIHRAEDDADLIAGDLLEVERLEEERKLEWTIERDVPGLLLRASKMPWARGGEDDRRFRKALAISLALSLLLGLLLPFVDLPIPERWEAVEVPERFASLIREEVPEPPPVVELPELEPVAPSDEASDEPAQEVVADVPAPKASESPAPKGDSGSKGILAFREKFAGLAEDLPAARLGSNARITSSGDAIAGLPERSMVATRAAGSSGGINVSNLSRDVGNGGGKGLGGVQVARATSSIGDGNGTGSGRPLAGGPAAGRTDEEIQIVFDRHKAALYRLYNRELRRDPTLKGQIVLRMTIESDGTVSLCEVKSTDMKSPTLSAQVVERVKTFDFGAKDGVPPVTIIYPIDFLPAA
ncbi:MAG: AgmX/PglI C-terminal domain-containing protein [Myxococcota bacterium]